MAIKLLYVINGLGTGGAERSIAELLPQLLNAGIQPTVACLHRREQGVQQAVLESGIDVRFLKSSSLLGRIRELRAMMRAESPDIVHTVLFDSDLAGRLAAVGLPLKVVTSHVNTAYASARREDPGVKAWKLRAACMVDGFTARHLVQRHHAITQAVADAAVRELGIPPHRVSVIERGRDPARLGAPGEDRRRRVRADLGIPDEAPVIINVGRQEFQKGQLHLLEATAMLAAGRPDLTVLIVGRVGNATPQLVQATRQMGIERQVRWLGHRDDVPDLLVAADVFAFPSVYEGLGGAVVEAMALGLPIVASDIPALREVLQESLNALLVPPRDGRALAGAIDRLLADAELRGQLGRAGARRFLERYRLDTSVERTIRWYEELALEDKRTARSRLVKQRRASGRA